jgi:hypothetical protein
MGCAALSLATACAAAPNQGASSPSDNMPDNAIAGEITLTAAGEVHPWIKQCAPVGNRTEQTTWFLALDKMDEAGAHIRGDTRAVKDGGDLVRGACGERYKIARVQFQPNGDVKVLAYHRATVVNEPEPPPDATPAPAPAPAAAPKEDIAARLQKLKDLHDKKAISDAEYDEQRQRILKESL